MVFKIKVLFREKNRFVAGNVAYFLHKPMGSKYWEFTRRSPSGARGGAGKILKRSKSKLEGQKWIKAQLNKIDSHNKKIDMFIKKSKKILRIK